MQVKSLSFKGYVPVKFYAKNPLNGKYSRVIKHENLRKCQGYIVRNLNGTAKKNKNEDFVDFYSQHDKDYEEYPFVMSMYDEGKYQEPVIYMITGRDADKAKELAKPVGIAKGESMEHLGNTKSFEAKYAARSYFNNIRYFLNKCCNRLKNENNKDLTLRVFFEPEYTKKTKELKGFKYVACDMTAEDSLQAV